jgi:2-polyprenyl-6-methoxyphenol hydroxylase-like FAD-dependent oxidoreductase
VNILIIGGGICGLGAAMLVARDGHDVTVLERDADPVPDSPHDAWENWTRKGVAQFRQPHNLMPGLRLLLESDLPDVQESLRRAGAAKFDFVNPLPPMLADQSPRPIDEKLWTYTARRPVAEWVFATCAQREPRVTVRRGAQVTELLTGPSAVPGVPHVTGVRTANGEVLRADLVVDATGRQSRAPHWLAAFGGPPPEDTDADCGFVYYTRYFRGTQPSRMGPNLMPLGSISILTLLGDNGTWSVTLFCATGDHALKNLRHEEKWTKVVRACPLHAHWLDGEPATGVLAMSGIVDRYRRFVVSGAPVATGLVPLADAWACTNPSAGRGLTVGFLHAALLRRVIREAGFDPRALVEAFHARTESEIAPWYDAQIAADRARFADMDALREGRELTPPTDPLARAIRKLFATMMADANLFRAAIEYIATITPVQQILERPAVTEAISVAVEAMKHMPPPTMPGPDRSQLLELVS